MRNDFDWRRDCRGRDDEAAFRGSARLQPAPCVSERSPSDPARAEAPRYGASISSIRSLSFSSSSGFTLLEVIVALALFAFAAMVLAGAYVSVLNSVESVKLDQSLEEELAFVRSQVLLEPELANVEAGGEVPTGTHGMATWSATVSPTTVADLFRVDLTVSLEGDGNAVEPREENETLFVLRTSWSQPTDRDKLREATRKRLTDLKQSRSM
jgi:general secretion pathway protein I